MSIKAFVFDVGGVLLRDGDVSVYEMWETRLGLEQGELKERLWSGEAWKLAECGKLTDQRFWSRIGEELGLSDREQIAALRDDLWDTWIVDAQVLSVVDRLRERYTVALMSNATDALEDLLENRYHILDRFETIINSARLGAVKPEQRIYKETLKRLAMKPEEVVFVDDRAENITAAAAMGMHVVWFVNAAELEWQIKLHLDHASDELKQAGIGGQDANADIAQVGTEDE